LHRSPIQAYEESPWLVAHWSWICNKRCRLLVSEKANIDITHGAEEQLLEQLI